MTIEIWKVGGVVNGFFFPFFFRNWDFFSKCFKFEDNRKSVNFGAIFVRKKEDFVCEVFRAIFFSLGMKNLLRGGRHWLLWWVFRRWMGACLETLEFDHLCV